MKDLLLKWGSYAERPDSLLRVREGACLKSSISATFWPCGFDFMALLNFCDIILGRVNGRLPIKDDYVAPPAQWELASCDARPLPSAFTI